MVPISKSNLEPKITTSIGYVDSIEEFDAIEIEPNTKIIRFDNFNQCFYFKERDKYGEYLPTKIFFYEDFAQKVSSIEREDFVEKCRRAGLDEIKTEIAIKFFLENEKPREVWLWLLENKIKDWEWDYVRALKYKLKLKLYKKL